MVARGAAAVVVGVWLAVLAAGPAAADGQDRPTAASARSDTLAALGHRLTLSGDGTGDLLTTIVLGASGPASLLLPFGYADATDFSIQAGEATLPPGSAGGSSPVRLLNGRRLLALAIGSAAAAGDSVRVHCRLGKATDWDSAREAFGAYDISRHFVNDAGVGIGTYRLEIVLPSEYRIKRVTGSEPAFKPQVSPDPPYTVTCRDGRDTATLTATPLPPGARARLGLVAERVRRGPTPLVAGLVMAALYLVAFRSQVQKPRPVGARVPKQEEEA